MMKRKFQHTIYYFNKYIEKRLCTKFYPLYFLRFIVGVLSQPVLPHCQITFQKAHCLTHKSWAVLQQDYRYWQRWSCTWNPCMSNTCISFFKDFRPLYLDGCFYWIELLRKVEWDVCISLHLQRGYMIHWMTFSKSLALTVLSALLPLLISSHGQKCLMFIRDEYVSLARRCCYK